MPGSRGASSVAIDDLPAAEAFDDMVVDHSRGLHVGIADRRADELKAALLEVLAERVRFWAGSREIF